MTGWAWVRVAVLGGVLTLGLQACGGQDPDGTTSATDTLTRAQKDSIAAELPVPGASGVGAALRARDAANARTQAHDTLN